jgi:Family of unknown function (DUF5677)
MADSNQQFRIVFGHPEFGPRVVEQFPKVFEVLRQANDALISLTDRGYDDISPLQRSILNLASYVGISAVEAITLIGNGLGLGAMKVLRGMLEGTINAEFLRLNPAELENYLDWGWVEQHKHHEFIRDRRADLFTFIPPEILEQTEREWNRVRNRFEFQDRRGRLRLRDSWTPLNLADRADRANLIEQYRHIYPLGSKLMHATVSGLSMHFSQDEDPYRLAAPPTLHYCGEALIGTHLCVISITRTLSRAVEIEPTPSFRELDRDFRYAWE